MEGTTFISKTPIVYGQLVVCYPNIRLNVLQIVYQIEKLGIIIVPSSATTKFPSY